MINSLSRGTKPGFSVPLTSVILVAILLTGSISGMVIPLQKANAQGVTITTSADSLGNAFFGEGAVQVVVNDPNADDDDLQETVTVDIDADPVDGTATSSSFTVAETSESSGRFEFFLVHVDSGLVATDFDAINTNGADEHPVSGTPAVGSAQASVIRFGPGADLALESSDLFEDVSFDITVGDEEVVVDYEVTASTLELDRSTYGSDSLLYMFIIDQDGNLNPTEPDSFDATATELNALLFDIDGATFDDAVTFEETGDNTARFEGIVQLATIGSVEDDQLVFTSEAVEMTLNDFADYVPPTDVTGSADTSSRSFDIDDEDGEVETIASLTFSSELKLTLNDNDRNRDSGHDETLDSVVTVYVDAVGGDIEVLDMAETDDNTGVFTIDYANNELPITFLADGEEPLANNGRLELRKSDITADILIEYNDASDDDSQQSITSSQTVELTLAIGTLNLPDTAGIGEEFLMTLTDADLNDNSRIKDSYTFVLNQNGPYPLARGGDPIGSLASLEFELEGDPVDFGTQNIAYTLVENDISSGVFTVELDMDDIVNFGNDGSMLDVDDGDTLDVTYNDLMDDVARESTDKLTIGEEVDPNEETCFDIAATIVGTEGHDVLNGTSGDDVIVGLRGNDVINGLGGDDVICGGLGLDELSGGSGDDGIFGGNGNDAISGNSGYDSLWGGQGWDRLFGGLGRDNLFGGVGNDLLEGGDGDDRLFGQGGTDRLDGGPGDNLLVQD